MLDPLARRVIDPPLNAAGQWLAGLGLSANAMTISGFVIGIGAATAVALEHYILGLGLFGLNRLADGLDGALARATTRTDLGGYLDIVLDFLVYAGFVLGFAVAQPGNALPAAILLTGFMGTATTFLTFAIFAAKRGIETERRGAKSLYYLGGLTEGTETIALFVLFCLLPDWFALLAYVFAAGCAVTTVSRILLAIRAFARAGADG